MPQGPRLLGCLDPAVFDEAALIIVIERLQGLAHRGIGQKTVLSPSNTRDCSMSGRPPHGWDRAQSQGGCGGARPRRAMFVIVRQACEAHDLSLPPLGPGSVPLSVADRMHLTAYREAVAPSRLRLCPHRDSHDLFGGHHDGCGTAVVGDMFNGNALPRAELQHTEQMEHVSRPSLFQVPAEALAVKWSDVIPPTCILPLKTCSVCATTMNVAPMASLEENTC